MHFFVYMYEHIVRNGATFCCMHFEGIWCPRNFTYKTHFIPWGNLRDVGDINDTDIHRYSSYKWADDISNHHFTTRRQPTIKPIIISNGKDSNFHDSCHMICSIISYGRTRLQCFYLDNTRRAPKCG